MCGDQTGGITGPDRHSGDALYKYSPGRQIPAMRWYVQASLDQVDSARALFYPSFDMEATFGLDAIHLDTLFKKTSRQFNFIPVLKESQLFDGGRLNANLEGTRAASNMMIERYNQSVLNAVRDVAVNGTRLQTLDDERDAG